MMNKIIILLLFPLTVLSQNAKEIAKKCISSTVSLVMEDNYKQPLSLGSGFIVENGKVVTNVHVIENATFGYVTISGETKKHNIEGYYAVDRKNDLVLLSVPSLIGTPIDFSSTSVEIGEKIYAIGNPKGLSGTISEGIISGVRTFEKEELIQITAPISPGSSGGPVINDNGKLIGVSVGALEEGQNLNFAIPAKFVTNLINLASNQLNKLNIKSTSQTHTSHNMQKSIKEGVEIVNIEWENNRLKGFSIKNNLSYEVSGFKLLLIIKDAQGSPIDSQEFEPYEYKAWTFENFTTYRKYVKPFLASYIEISPLSSSVNNRIKEKKPTDKLEIRILDFVIKE